MSSKGSKTPSSLSALEQELLAAISSPSQSRGRAGTPSNSPSNGATRAPSSACTRRRPRPEEHAATATAADRQAAFLSHRRRLERTQGRSSRQQLPREEDRQAKVLTKRGDSDELVGPWNRFFDEIDIQVNDEDWWGTNIYAKSQRGGTVDGTEDSMDLEDEEEPPSADPDFPVSQRWKERGPEGPAKARWATARYQAKKRVKRTPAWLTATPEARGVMERAAADAIPFIPDAVPARPVAPRAMEPWLRSEREALLRIIDDNNRRPGPRNRLATVTKDYNLRMDGIGQKKGELCLAVDNGHSRRDSKLTEDRIAPVRTQGSIQGNMIKWINERAICDCRQYQQYHVGDFERSGDFPYDHAAEGCTPPDREDACKCLSYLRDYNGNLPDRHHSDYCG